jgi:protein subunit release factor A
MNDLSGIKAINARHAELQAAKNQKEAATRKGSVKATSSTKSIRAVNLQGRVTYL